MKETDGNERCGGHETLAFDDFPTIVKIKNQPPYKSKVNEQFYWI